VSRRWVLATRAAEELGVLADALGKRGVEVLPLVVTREVPVDDAAGRARVDAALGAVRFVAFTSKRAPRALRRAAPDLIPELATKPAAAVGPATADAARRDGFDVQLVGDGGGEALASALAPRLRPGDAVLHPCGRERRDEFAAALERAGARVVPFVVYAMDEVPANEAPPLPEEPPSAVVLTSPRAVRAYVARCGARWAEVPHIAIGATTAAAAAAAGVRAVAAPHPTTESIVEELWQTCL
jgi:uroporphyrinogen-III synthase